MQFMIFPMLNAKHVHFPNVIFTILLICRTKIPPGPVGICARSAPAKGSVEATFQRPVFVERVRVAPHSKWGPMHLKGAQLQVEQDGKWVAVGTGKLSGEDEWIPVSARHAFSGTSLLPEPPSVPGPKFGFSLDRNVA